MEHSKIRADLDAAITAAMPHAGGRVRVALAKLRNELLLADERRAKRGREGGA